MAYDSRADTLEHIEKVRSLLTEVTGELDWRAGDHDLTKLQDPEKAIFDEFTPKLAESTYGSDEYKRYLVEMKVALDHHYSVYRHHPEHFVHGIHDMNLLDLTEMLADWKAATLRHENGDLGRSIEQNAERFGYGDEIKRLLMNTATHMGWL